MKVIEIYSKNEFTTLAAAKLAERDHFCTVPANIDDQSIVDCLVAGADLASPASHIAGQIIHPNGDIVPFDNDLLLVWCV